VWPWQGIVSRPNIPADGRAPARQHGAVAVELSHFLHIIFTLLILHLPLFAMNDALHPQPLAADNPFVRRKTVQHLHGQEGEIVKLDPANFGIQSAGGGPVLLPLNLPAEFQQAGAKILFSGSVKEVGLNELFAGPPLVLTQVQKH
jgi:hypothetical protein